MARAARATADSVAALAGGGVARLVEWREVARRCLDSMDAAVRWRETGVGRPPEQTCMDSISELQRLLSAPTPPARAADSVLEDAARLDWLLLHISGAEFRRIGVHYSGNASRADVDAARKQGANHD